ncbi:MAG: ABC transporter ATP-binding protein [Deltaproteobacteria bacterium]|nr:ABC transporter ATP-binding protein [Deltaproteobacteria bacterium]
MSEVPSQQPVVVVDRVSKSYRRGAQLIHVLKEINLTIEEGSFVALMGPSGSGKSTLLNLIAGIDRPDAGSLVVAGTDITQLDESELAAWRTRHVGFIFQFYNLLPVLTGLENVELPLLLSGLSRRQRREHAMVALELVGLSHRIHHYPRELSGGEQQRVAIARAIVTDPTLLVADEPTGDLDKASATEVLGLMDQLNRDFGKTIIMVTHDPHAAAKAGVTRHLDKGVLNNSSD